MKNEPIIVTGKLVDKIPRILLWCVIGFGLISLVYFKEERSHFFHSYLTSLYFYTSLSLGALFFVIVQHAVGSGWSVVVRRIPELMTKNFQLLAILFLPLLLGLFDLYHWTHPEAVMHDHLLQIKAPYLNLSFFFIRLCVYWGIWIWLSNRFYKRSVLQDKTADQDLTRKSKKQSTYGILLFALTITFSAIDWIMSLSPHWFSTIFGVYMFAGAAVGSLCAISLILMLLRKYGYLKDIVNVEHYHDLGKLIYGFVVFWAYIAFSQYFLIWYANIPEETFWFKEHFFGSWNTVAIVLTLGHFAIPFVLFMSRHAKRNLKFHAITAIWLLVMHYLDLFWVIMPSINQHVSPELRTGFSINLFDISIFITIGSLYFRALFKRMKKVSIIAYNDPLIKESVKFENI